MPPTPAQITAMGEAYAKAWSSHDPHAVAAFYEKDGRITINDGQPTVGRDAFVEVAKAFYAEFPDLIVHMDDIRAAGNSAVFRWTLEGTHFETKNRVKVPGWEAWRLSDDVKVIESDGRFDALEYERQIQEGV